MINLDNQAEIEKFDKGKILASIRLLPDQMEQAWEEVKKLEIPKACFLANNVVIAGMGGSALGGRIVDSLIADRVRIPIEVFTQYDLPNYVNEKTLVIANSYSGNTEETVSMAKQAIEKKAKIIGVATGGKIADLMIQKSQPSYIFEPRANPSGQPRMGLGYSIMATIAILSKCGFVHLSEDDFYELAVTTKRFIKKYDTDVEIKGNIAKKISKKLHNRAVILIASGHLVGVVHAFKNQLNENAKVFSTIFNLPELNHHLLEGLKYPTKAKEVFHFLLFDSDLYDQRIRKRLKLTADVIEKNNHQFSTFKPRSEKKLSQIFEVLSAGSFISFYLALLYGVDPNKIPWVDYFKEKLAKA